MPTTAMWTHGNAASAESPENVDQIVHIGWGTEFHFKPGKLSWIHIPIPSPVLIGDQRSKLTVFFVLFNAKDGEVRAVHLFDGPNRVREFNDLAHTGEHAGSFDAQTIYRLDPPHTVFGGMGISLLFAARIGFEGGAQPLLLISTAGGDFQV